MLYGYTVIRLYGYTVIRLYDDTVIRLYGYTIIRLYGYTVIRLYGYTVIRFDNKTYKSFSMINVVTNVGFEFPDFNFHERSDIGDLFVLLM